jgi:thioredoxin-dependent peroxiredoxin
LQAAGADVIGVSGDAQATLLRFAEELELPYRLVGDPKGTIRGAWGVKWPVIGLARRVSFVVGRDRTVRHVHHAERDVDSHAATACAFLARPRR